MNSESNPPKPRGCFFYGCLTLAVLALLAAVLGVVGYYVVKATAARWINEYTATTPALIEKSEYSVAQMDALKARLAVFQQALDKGDVSTELVLSAEDLNALIDQEPQLQGRLFVQIDVDAVKGEVSLPLKNIGPLKLQGRYLNGTATFK